MLTRYDTVQLKRVVKVITDAVATEKIFLLAAQTTGCRYENIFSSVPACRREVTHYYLLVLIENNQQRSNESWQDTIEHRCRTATPVTAWVLPAASFAQWLEAGQPFAVKVFNDALLCYDAGRVWLFAPPEVDAAEMERTLRRECMLYMKRSAGFLKGSEMCYLRRQFRLAAFMLHQSAEQAYIAINWRMTGFRPMVHSLEKLHRYALPFSSALATVFPKNNEREEYLFRLLQRAYIDTRYTSDYTIRGADLLSLTTRVQKLHEVVSEVCGRGLRAV